MLRCFFHYLKLLIALPINVRRIMATQKELTEQLAAQGEQIKKIGGETRTLIDLNKALLEQVANAPVTSELKAAADAVDAQLKIVDDLVPDEAPPTP